MEFFLSKKSPYNFAFLIGEDLTPLYRVATPQDNSGYANTTITKVEESTEVSVGYIEHHKIFKDVVKARDAPVLFKKARRYEYVGNLSITGQILLTAAKA
jgi:hypothetical protein